MPRKYILWLKREYKTDVKKMIHEGKTERTHILDTVLANGTRGLSRVLMDIGPPLARRTSTELRSIFRSVGSGYEDIVSEWPETDLLPWGYVKYDIGLADPFDRYLKLKRKYGG